MWTLSLSGLACNRLHRREIPFTPNHVCLRSANCTVRRSAGFDACRLYLCPGDAAFRGIEQTPARCPGGVNTIRACAEQLLASACLPRTKETFLVAGTFRRKGLLSLGLVIHFPRENLLGSVSRAKRRSAGANLIRSVTDPAEISAGPSGLRTFLTASLTGGELRFAP